MDFCVKCGKKDVYQESLCRKCYEKVYAPRAKKKKMKKAVKQEKGGQYYEAILQLRNVGINVVDFVRDLIEGSRAFVSKEEQLKNGIDFYLSDIRFTKQLGVALQRKFGGVVKISAKLYSVSRLTSRKIYRVTVLFKRPKFDVGDFINFKGKKLRVLEIKKYVLAVGEGGKKQRLRFAMLEKARLL